MCSHNSSFRLQYPTKYVLENFVADFRVKRTNRIVDDVDIAITVDGPRNRYPLLLSSGEVDPPLPDLGKIVSRQNQ